MFYNNSSFSFSFNSDNVPENLMKALLGETQFKIEPTYQILLDQPDKIYNDKIEALKNKIDDVLVINNKELFMKLSKEYRMLVD